MKKKKDFKLMMIQQEIYRRLRSNIEFAGEEKKVIAIIGCGPDDGKSTISFNLAATFAETGQKCVIVDGDMRKSALKERLGIEDDGDGLSEYLGRACELEKVISSSTFSNLSIIHSGKTPGNPTELLAGARFKELVDRLKEQFDYIIIDTPPLNRVIDAAMIARACDGVVMVIPSDSYTRSELLLAKEQLESAGSEILGVVLNRYNTRKTGLKKNMQYGNYYG